MNPRTDMPRNKRQIEAILAALLLPVVPAFAQQTITGARPDFSAPSSIQITSTGFADNAPMPNRFSGYEESKSPALHWTAIANAKSYAIVVEDPDAHPAIVVHWTLWNIPADATSLPAGLPKIPRLGAPNGAVQGLNSHKTVGYTGPKPPAGDAAHHYHFQVFALDRLLDVKPGSSRDDFIAAAAGHVLAKGDLVGLYAKAQQ